MTDSRYSPPDVDMPLTDAEIRTMFCGFLRYPPLLKEALSFDFDSSRFRYDEQRYAAVFAALRSLHEQYGTVSRQMLETELLSMLDSGRIALHDDDIVFLFGTGDADAGGAIGLIAEGFTQLPADEAQQRAERQYMETILRRFIQIRLIKSQLQHMLNRGTEDTAPDHIHDFLQRFNRISQRVESIGALTTNDAHMPAFGEHIELPPPPMPTGIAWIDQYIGGFCPGHMIGLLAPQGGGKTTLLSITVARMAELYFNQNINKLAVFIGYEMPAIEAKKLLYSAAARIARSAFVNVDSASFWQNLSDQNSLKDYERQLPENRNGTIIASERERWAAACEWFNRHCVLLDFSCNTAAGSRGTGGVVEVQETLERLAEERRMEIGTVCIDYIGIMCERMLSAAGQSTDMHSLIRPIKQAPDDLRTKVAQPMGCTVLAAHQIAMNEVKKVRPYQYLSHADAAFAKSFAENMMACVCLNSPDTMTRVSTLHWSKIRFGVPLTYYGLIRQHDAIVDAELVNDQYVACPATRAIISRNDVRVASPAQPTRADNNRRRGWAVDNFAGDMT